MGIITKHTIPPQLEMLFRPLFYLNYMYIGVLREKYLMHTVCHFLTIEDNFAKIGTSKDIKNVNSDNFKFVRRLLS